MAPEIRRYQLPVIFREVTYETDVTQSIRDEIAGYRSSGRSLEASVALLIIREGNDLPIRFINESGEDLGTSPDFDLATFFVSRAIHNAYQTAAKALLNAESILAMGEPLSDDVRQLQQDILEYESSSEGDPKIAMRFTTVMAEEDMHLRVMAEILRRDGALEFINAWTDYEIRNHLYDAEEKDALEMARQRFNLVYTTTSHTPGV